MISTAELVALAATNHLMLTDELVRAAGVSAGRWRRLQDSGEWVQVTPGHFRHAATPLTFEMHVRAGAAWLGARGALFGATALRWLGVDVAGPTLAEFVVPRGGRSVANWMRIHTSLTFSSTDFIWHHGVRTTTAARALVDYASTMPTAHALGEAIDGAISARRTTVERVINELRRVRAQGRKGVRLMSELLLDSGGESYLERRFLRLLRANGLPTPKQQVAQRQGDLVMRVDFTFDALVVEVSGRRGHVLDRDRTDDAARRNALQQSGHTVLEFTTAMVIDDPNYVLRTLAASGIVPVTTRHRPPSA